MRDYPFDKSSTGTFPQVSVRLPDMPEEKLADSDFLRQLIQLHESLRLCEFYLEGEPLFERIVREPLERRSAPVGLRCRLGPPITRGGCLDLKEYAIPSFDRSHSAMLAYRCCCTAPHCAPIHLAVA